MSSVATDTMDSTEDETVGTRSHGSPEGDAEPPTAEPDAIARTRAQLRQAREDVDVFSQLTSGYWWRTVRGPSGLLVEAWATRNFSRTTGYDREFVQELTSAKHVHPDDKVAYERTVGALIRGSEEGGRDRAVHEFRLFGRDDAVLWVRQRLQGRDQGADRRVYASGELITERKRTEDALGHVEARFLSLVEHAPNVIVTIDLEGTILFVNRSLPVDEREPWELIGSSVFQLAGGQNSEEVRDAIAQIIECKGAYEFVLSARASKPEGDTRARWYQVQGAPVMRGGSVAAITMILTDITERREAELALRRSEARWRFLWENVPDQITELDEGGRVLVSNRALGGRDPGRSVGELIFDLLTPEAAQALRSAIEQANSTRAPAGYELCVSPDEAVERPRWWSHRVVPYLEGRDRGYLLIATDISDRKAAERERANLEAQLRQQQKLESIGTLASGVAHEINNPIQGIMNYADLVRMRVPPGGDVEDFATEIIAETERVATIVRNLLSFARQEKEHHGSAQMREIIESSVSLMRAALRRDHVQLRVEMQEDLPKIKCRSQQIQQVVMSLVANAREALNKRYPGFHEDKVVTVCARLEHIEGEDWIVTTIEDKGPGIEPEYLERVFDPFFTTKGRDASRGLGLSVSHGIVHEHRGELEVESVPGEFTRFRIKLRVDNGWGIDWNS